MRNILSKIHTVDSEATENTACLIKSLTKMNRVSFKEYTLSRQRFFALEGKQKAESGLSKNIRKKALNLHLFCQSISKSGKKTRPDLNFKLRVKF